MPIIVPFANDQQRAVLERRLSAKAAAEAALVAALEPLAAAHGLGTATFIGLAAEGMVFDVPEPTP